MVQGFEDLTDQQFDTLKKAVSWITILIAGADGNIDQDEKEWAKKITQIRSYSLPGDLHNFYQEVGKDFSAQLDALVAELPGDVKQRNQILTERLKTVNPVLQSWKDELAEELYKSFKSFAKHVAKSSGGFLGMMSISPEERKLIDLPMIDKVVFSDEEE